MLVSDVLNTALTHIGAYGPGNPVTPSDQALALFWANLVLDSLSARKLSPLGLATTNFTLTGAASYTYGTGSTWNAPRPMKIKSASVTAANGVQKEAHISSAEEYRAIPDLTRTGIYVENLFWDMGYPTGTIFVTPMPNAGSMVLETYQAVINFVNLSDAVSLAPGYPEAVILILAYRLAMPFGRPNPEMYKLDADEAVMRIADLQAEILGSSPPTGATLPMPPPPGQKT